MKKVLKFGCLGAVVLALVIIVIVIIGVATAPKTVTTGTTPSRSVGAPATPATSASAAASDGDTITVTSCSEDEYGLIHGNVTIVNKHDTVQSYLITLSANDTAGTRVAELNGAANSVAPGQTAKLETIGSSTASTGKKTAGLACTVANVTQF